MRQTISCLCIQEPFVLRDDACDDIPDHIFKIHPFATYINVARNVVLPKAISKDLGRQLSTCYHLSELWIPNQPLVAAEITDFLGRNRNLRFLDIRFCNLSRNEMGRLCEQIRHLCSLKHCSMSGNVLGDAVGVLAESIKAWGMSNSLVDLNLCNCNITPGGCSKLLEALEVCPNLRDLGLSRNTIGGAFDALICKPVYPRLFHLNLDDTSLTLGDIQTIYSLIKGNKMPQLSWLDISYGSFGSLELNFLETLELLNFIIHDVPHVSF